MRPRLPMSLWRVPPWPDGGGPARRPIILLYHAVSKLPTDPWGIRVQPRNFAEQMAVLAAHTRPMRLCDLDAALKSDNIPPRTVIVTFDDGFADNLHRAKPILERYHIPATVFISSGYVDSRDEFWADELDRILLQPGRVPEQLKLIIGEREHQWKLDGGASYGMIDAFKARHWRAWHEHFPTSRQSAFRAVWAILRESTTRDREQALEDLRNWAGLAKSCRPERLCVSMDELKQLAAGDLVEIGAHTVTHPSLGAIPVEQQRFELFESKAFLESALAKPVPTMAYPFGSRQDYSQQTIEMARQAGYACACSNFPEVIKPEVDRYQYPRRNVLDWQGREFARWLAKWFAEEE